MKRWNGWGDRDIQYPLPAGGAAFLKHQLGEYVSYPDADLQSVIQPLPPSGLPENPLVDTSPEGRLYHARGQSLPDWVALRSGRVPAVPAGVGFPSSGEEVRELMKFAQNSGARIIPYGGGTSVVGHITPREGDSPVLTLDCSRLNGLLDLDRTSRLATFGAGVAGPALEEQLNAQGYTLGHFPQSFEYSTLGGWIATRSSGQQSRHYGRIEDLFAGGVLETPRGRISLQPFPASAAGPDLRQLVLGSEGRLGIITQATVRVQPLPEREDFYGVFFDSWASGVAALREIAQAGLPVSMLRLSDPLETRANLALSGRERLAGLADRGLRLLGYGEKRCLLIFGLTGSRGVTEPAYYQLRDIFSRQEGLFTGKTIGRLWEKSRFRTPYLRNTLWELGIALDTLETALPWKNVEPAAAAVLAAIRQSAESFNERVLAFAHLSHVYPDGASIYVTVLFRRCQDPDELLARWRSMKEAASLAIVAHQGTISHQHGVGQDHIAYLESEKGALGLEALRSVCRELDPQGIMNPGKLLGDVDE